MSEGKAPLGDFDPGMLEALAETMFLAAHADGEFTGDERAAFAKHVASITDGRVAGAAFEDMLARFAAVDDAERPARLAAIKAKLPAESARKVAFSLAVQVALADGIVRTTERELLLDLADALDLDRDAAADMVRDLAKA